ncbi:MAG: fatty acid desaturase [Myxococcales bacterium]|nr:fatty acid desaturase [Myxococcales bacterium]MBL0198347.1 fatty acid desaturase [Myxococcales bacterium]
MTTPCDRPPAPAPPPIDYEAFARDLDALRRELDASLGVEHFEHLRKLERWGHACSTAGYATAWLFPNPISMALISTGSMARWAILAHHVGHRSMDRVSGVPERYTSRGFAKGRRRLVDWFDWMHPDAWNHEHNVLHHYHTGEVADPDLVEENAAPLRDAKIPLALKYLAVGFYALTWKVTYYAPNTFQILERAKARRARRESGVTRDARGPEPYLEVFDPRTPVGRGFWSSCLLPYGLGRFVVIPALFLPLGPLAALSVWVNSVGAEALTNLHTFAIIVPNHAGDDLYRFEGVTRDRAELYVRQVAGSANYETGGDLRDFMHGFLNYQIEHHLFPDLPPLAYQRAQPRVKELCAKHGVPYVQGSVWSRVKKLADILVGKTSMRWGDGLSRRARAKA